MWSASLGGRAVESGTRGSLQTLVSRTDPMVFRKLDFSRDFAAMILRHANDGKYVSRFWEPCLSFRTCASREDRNLIRLQNCLSKDAILKSCRSRKSSPAVSLAVQTSQAIQCYLF